MLRAVLTLLAARLRLIKGVSLPTKGRFKRREGIASTATAVTCSTYYSMYCTLQHAYGVGFEASDSSWGTDLDPLTLRVAFYWYTMYIILDYLGSCLRSFDLSIEPGMVY